MSEVIFDGVGENKNADSFKDPEIIKRFKDILAFKNKEHEHILFALNAMIQNMKFRELTAV